LPATRLQVCQDGCEERVAETHCLMHSLAASDLGRSMARMAPPAAGNKLSINEC
jgi:hypothetical protein